MKLVLTQRELEQQNVTKKERRKKTASQNQDNVLFRVALFIVLHALAIELDVVE